MKIEFKPAKTNPLDLIPVIKNLVENYPHDRITDDEFKDLIVKDDWFGKYSHPSIFCFNWLMRGYILRINDKQDLLNAISQVRQDMLTLKDLFNQGIKKKVPSMSLEELKEFLAETENN